MKTIPILSLMLLFMVASNTLHAQKQKGKGNKTTVTKTTKTYQSPNTNKKYKSNTVKVEKHNNHPNSHKTTVVKVNRYPRNKVVVVKPRKVYNVTVLPTGYTTIIYGKRNYYCHNGYFYHYHDNIYTTIVPPFGLRIKVLPFGYRSVFIAGVPHYYYRGVYYMQRDNEYEVVEPKVGVIVPELPEDNVEEVTIDGNVYYAFDDILYKSIVTTDGVQYEVVGKLDD